LSRISPSFPARVGSYDLLAPIGAGGMATVYLGLAQRHGGFQRYVAVKMIHGTVESDAHLAADLLREAKLVAKIRHPNVVPVLDVGEDPRGLYLVMEYVEGDNLAALRRAAKRAGENIPDAIGLRIVADALAGLHAAHELKDASGSSLEVVHRDFSPQNILVGTDGVSRLTDFGVAKVASTAGHTRTGKIKGKIAYMAPEQARGQKVDRRCDVWAAGVVAWEVLTGQRLHEAEDELGALLKIVNEDPPRLRSVRADLPEELDEALSAALTRDREQRCPTAEALRRRLVASLPMADTTEVADFVRRIVGPKLAARERRIEELRRERSGERNVLSGEGSLPFSSPEPVSSVEHAIPPRSELDVAVTRVREDTTGATIAWNPADFPSDPAAASASAGVTDRVERSVEWALGERRRRAAIIGIASGLGVSVVTVSVLVLALKGSSATAPATSGMASASESALPAPSLSPPPGSSEPSTELPLPSSFTVRSNQDVSEIRVGSITIKIEPATRDIAIDRPAPGTRIVLVGSDGRRVTALAPSEGDELRIDFPRRPSGGGVKPPKGGDTSPVPFADNPYKKR
jgi:serine/threonine-protein kinase